jgi:hypothetical protein
MPSMALRTVGGRPTARDCCRRVYIERAHGHVSEDMVQLLTPLIRQFEAGKLSIPAFQPAYSSREPNVWRCDP